MAPKPQAKPAVASAATQRSNTFVIQLVGVCSIMGILALINFALFVFTFVAMLPSYIYFVSAQVSSQSHHTTRNAIMINFAGMCPWVPDALSRGSEFSKMVGMLIDWKLFLATWGATFAIILTTYIASITCKRMAIAYVQREVKKLRDEQTELIDEWGTNVISGTVPPALQAAANAAAKREQSAPRPAPSKAA
ncbi:MAG: hypothetical protein FJX46_02000 [Alphaproteobacteria bacterium]|nr:hypothetical protein [Alphaproteobacteria bacterium]